MIDMTVLRVGLLREAVVDYRFLLNRGYRREPALNMVTSRYQLSTVERMALLRGVMSLNEAESRRSKLVRPEMVKGRRVIIDGFNVLMTIRAALLRRPLILCDDGFIRDISSAFEKVKVTASLYTALEIMLFSLKRLKPANVTVFFDSGVSKSGLFAAYTRRCLLRYGLTGGSVAVKKADVATLSVKGLVASSDAVIILRSYEVADLGGWIASKIAPESLLDIGRF